MRPLEDSPHDQHRRRQLVKTIRQKGITDQRVLEAIASIPRQFFMKAGDEHLAYEDKAFPIGEGQTISQPYTVAYQTQLLDVQPFDKILEIGTGSAYQACILAAMGADVFTIERQRKLFERNKRFDYLNTFRNIHFFYGDGYLGLPPYAPFDKILLTAAAPEIPPALIDQLKAGGLLVAPVGERKVQQMVRLTKREDGTVTEEAFDRFSFVPMLKGKQE